MSQFASSMSNEDENEVVFHSKNDGNVASGKRIREVVYRK